MPLVVVRSGQLAALDAILAGIPMYAFPFRNDRVPKITDTLVSYTEANFSGYSGPIAIGPWDPATFEAGRGIARGASLQWTHDGGGTDNLVYGVVWVITASNVLFAAERDPRAPVTIDPDHRVYTYTPVLTDRAEFAP